MASNPFLWLTLTFIDLYLWIVVAGVILSWLVAFNVVNQSNRFVYMVADFVYRITEPALRPIRNILPNMGNFDLSAVVLIVLLMFAQRFIIWAFVQIG